MESIRRLHEEILKREYKAEKQRKEEMRYDQMDCLLLAGEEKTERTIPVCETVFPEKFADLNAVREVLLTPEKQVYALIAPAFMGQFGEGVSPGAIRAALKRAGFSGMCAGGVPVYPFRAQPAVVPTWLWRRPANKPRKVTIFFP